MRIEQPGREFPLGYTAITEQDGAHAEMLMDFGILRLGPNQQFTDASDKERAYLLIDGELEFGWRHEGQTGVVCAVRRSVLDEEPCALQLPSWATATLKAGAGGCEIAVQAARNSVDFAPRVWQPGDYRSEEFGKGTMQDTSTRRVRTIFDAATAPSSAMVMGEVVNFPGKWSSYPPHNHAQPEVYHFRFFPSQGFGYSEQGDTVYRVGHCDTVTIDPFVLHPQTAAPGYAMYYVWMIPHLPDDRFGPDSRVFVDQHRWLLNSAAQIWPDASIHEILRQNQYR